MQQPDVPAWWLRVAALNIAQACVIYLGAISWDRWLPDCQLCNTQSLGRAGSVLLGYLVITFMYSNDPRAIGAITSVVITPAISPTCPGGAYLFGTFDNPRRNPSECGFPDQRETQLLHMLSGRSPS